MVSQQLKARTEASGSFPRLKEFKMKQDEENPDASIYVDESLKTRIHFHCRVCANISDADELVPVFGDVGCEMQLLEKIHAYLPIMVTEEDLLPVRICLSCVWKLEQCHEFVSSCVDADTKFKKILGFETCDEKIHTDEQEAETRPENSSFNIKKEPYQGQDLEINQDNDYAEDSDESSNFSRVNMQFVETEGVNESSDLGHVNMQFVKAEGVNNELVHRENENFLKNGSDLDLSTQSMWKIDETADDDSNHADIVESTNEMGDVSDTMTRDNDNRQNRRLSVPNRKPSKTIKKKKEKPKFRVVILKMKNAMDMTSTPEFKKALDRAIKNKKPHQISTRKHLDQEDLDMLSRVKTGLESSGADSLRKKPSGHLSEEMGDDHTYTYKKPPILCCKYCKKTFRTGDSVIAHQASAHSNKISSCTDCKIVFDSSKLLEAHLRRHKNKSATNIENKLLMKPIVYIKKLHPFILGNTAASRNSSTRTEWKEECEIIEPQAEKNKNDINVPFSKNSKNVENSVDNKIVEPDIEDDMDNTIVEPDIEDDIKVVDVHVEPEISSEHDTDINSKVCLKLSEEFEYINNDYKTKIIKSINRIIESNSNYKKVGSEPEKLITENKQNKEIPLQSSLNIDIKNQIWRCDQCNHISRSPQEYHKHNQTHPSLYTCHHCGKKFTSKKNLDRHTYIHSDGSRFVCEYCGRFCKSWFALKNHLIIHKERKKTLVKCKVCGKEFGSNLSYRNHAISHTEPSFLCEICGKSMKYRTSLRSHRRLHTGEYVRRHACIICGKRYRSRVACEEHVRIHTNEKPFECLHCGKCFRTHYMLVTHKAIHINARQHKCPICGRGFNRLQHAKNHIQTHQKSRTFTCKFCYNTFPSLGDLLVHRRTHTTKEIQDAMELQEKQSGPRIAYSCQICGKQLSSKLTLKNHVMLHVGDMPFSCEVCGKKFAAKHQLRSHQLLHTGEKPFSCRYCSTAFRFKHTLVVHERIHTGETPYGCTMCDKKFRSRASLNQHVLLHSGERPYKCPYCDKRFKRPDNVTVHLRIHTGERPYACTVCGRKFKQMGDRNKHQQRHVPKVEIVSTD